MLVSSNGYWERWLVTQRMGLDRGTPIHPSISDSFRRRELALMPRGGVAALIDSSDATGGSTGTAALRERARKISCFLPLPVRSDLPVNINAHFALDHETRRNLWPYDVSPVHNSKQFFVDKYSLSYKYLVYTIIINK